MLSDVIHTFKKIPWLPAGSSMVLTQMHMLPPVDLVTSVHAFCFSDDQLLMVKHDKRGWDIPGGHIEAGETMQEALARELQEEAAAEATELTPLAMLHIDVANPPLDYPYPVPSSYICCFLGRLGKLDSFTNEFETSERSLMGPDKVRSLPWYVRNQQIFEFALRTWKD